MNRLLTVFMLAAPISVAAQSPGLSPQDRFWNAAIAGDTVALAKALTDGANVDSLDTRTARNGRRALNWAALNNRADAIRWLLAHGATIEATNLTGFTALHHAAEAGAVDATRVLLEAGADPKHTNYDGVTPLARARADGNLDVAELLEAAERKARPTVRQQLDAVYAENTAAFLRGDAAAIMRLRAPDFHAITPDGVRHERPEMEMVAQGVIHAVKKWNAITFTIDSLQVSGDTAFAIVSQHTDRMALRSDNQVHHLETWVTQRETWIRSAQGWLLWRVDQLRNQKRLVDGQPE